MDKDFENIIEEFKKINKKGYIQGINNNTNSAGLTFENLLEKKPDSLFFPDFNGVEIKTTCRYSRYDIGLFTISFDGPELFESNYLLEKYGEYDLRYTENKKLIISLKLNKKVNINNKYYFELKLDYERQKLFIRIYDINKFFLEDRAFVYFETLERRIYAKLNKLALIYASKKKVNDFLFFRYYKIICYKFKNFDMLLKLIKMGDIHLSLVLRFSKSGVDVGKTKNKNLCFTIKKESIDKLFDKVFLYEN